MNNLHRSILLIAIIGALIVCACSRQSGREMSDRSGRSFVISGPLNRIVSTAPSNTEIIADLGMAHKLVAIDRHSANVKAPEGYPEIPGDILLIDFFFPDAEVLIALQPDIIIASGHNATGSGDDPFKLLRDMGIPVVYISMSRSIDDIYDDIAFIADLLQIHEKGNKVISSMKEQIQNIIEALPHSSSPPPSLYFEISPAPDMITFGRDSFIDSMISALGAVNIFAHDNWIVNPQAEAIIERNPDIILTNVTFIDDPIGEIKRRPGFEHINAVIHNRVYQIDTDSSVRPSPRIILALRQMAEAIYPEVGTDAQQYE